MPIERRVSRISTNSRLKSDNVLLTFKVFLALDKLNNGVMVHFELGIQDSNFEAKRWAWSVTEESPTRPSKTSSLVASLVIEARTTPRFLLHKARALGSSGGSGKYLARRTNVNDEFSRIGIDMTREQLCHAHTLLQFLYSKFIIMKNDLYQIKAKKMVILSMVMMCGYPAHKVASTWWVAAECNDQ